MVFHACGISSSNMMSSSFLAIRSALLENLRKNDHDLCALSIITVSYVFAENLQNEIVGYTYLNNVTY